MPAFEERTATAAAEKRAIGLAAAGLLDDGDTVLLDGGTTTMEVARALVGRRLQVVTNSLPIAQLLASSPQTDLILIGGYIYPRTGVALGPLAIASMQSIRVRTAILGAGGIVAEGIYNSNSLLVETERQMMELRPGSDDRRRPHQVWAPGPGTALWARGRRSGCGRLGALGSRIEPCSRQPACRFTRRRFAIRATITDYSLTSRSATTRGPTHDQSGNTVANPGRIDGPLDPPEALGEWSGGRRQAQRPAWRRLEWSSISPRAIAT